jgi:ABC-type transporter Mla maintaining outer membrane lipid asymmetry ATPase subunit MlaF
MTTESVLRMTNVRKSYQALRPLRLRELSLDRGDRVALAGLDAGAGEVLVNLVTGASLPDEGDVVVVGHNTRAIADGDEWLASLDRFGIVSPRAVLLDAATLLQNLVMPFTLQIDPPPPDIAARARAIGVAVGIDERSFDAPIAGLSPDVRLRAHVARAMALDPALLILEHPTAGLTGTDHSAVAADIARAIDARGLTTLAISQDARFSKVIADRRYTLQAGTGELKPVRRFPW